MIRGALASRYGISPLGRGVIRPASGGWWLSGGIAAANCIAAYQAKGAASYAASKVNLANPGTYNATTPVGDVPWDVTDGWKGDGTNYFDTGFAPRLLDWTVIVRASNVPGAVYTNPHKAFFGSNRNGTINLVQIVKTGWLVTFYHGMNSITPNISPTSGVWAVKKGTAFYNGTGYSFTSSSIATDNTRTFYILATHYDSVTSISDIYIQSISFYNTTLTDEQVVAVTNAMAAL